MKETKITKDRIRNHFAYSWWKYVLMACVAIFGWNLIYTTSAYKAPKAKRLDVTFVTYGIPDEVLNGFRAEILSRYPQIEDSAVGSITYTPEDSYYGNIQLTTYMGAGEGDIYLLPKDRFEVYAKSGAFVPLDDAVASGALDLRGMDVKPGIVTDEYGTTALYGIPMTDLYGIMNLGIDNRDLVMTVMSYTLNADLAIDWMDWQIERYLAEKPDWLVEQEAKTGVTQEQSEIPSY